MQPKQLQHSKGTELDRLFEQGVSNIERAPQKTLSDEQIKVAAAASKGGAGIWLLAHAKEILIVLILFLVGVVATIPLWHSPSTLPGHPQISTSQTDARDVYTDTNLNTHHDICQHEHNVQMTSEHSHTVPVPRSLSSVTDPTANSQSQQAITNTSDITPSDSPAESVVVEQTDIPSNASHVYDTQVVQNTPNMPNSQRYSEQPQIVDLNLTGYTEIQTTSSSDRMDDESSEPEQQDPNETIKPKTKERKRLSSPFDGFHVGCLIDAGIMSPAKLSSTTYIQSKPGGGGRIGLEFSYHFNKYFGVSAGMDYGTTGAFRYHAHCDMGYIVPFDKKDYAFYHLGISLPVKFEFHAPISPKVWVTLSTGMRLRVPWGTIFIRNKGILNSGNSLIGVDDSDETEEPYPQLNLTPSVLDPNRINVDILANVGFYFQLGKNDFLRWTIGVSCPIQDFSTGSYSLHMIEEVPSTVTMHIPPPTDRYENGTYRLRSNMFYMQIVYIHTFKKRKQ